MKWLLAALVVVAIAVITCAFIAENRWTARCDRAGGHNVQRYEGTILMPVGQVLVPEPQYSDHCIVGDREVKV